jgi:hypothetical protein
VAETVTQLLRPQIGKSPRQNQLRRLRRLNKAARRRTLRVSLLQAFTPQPERASGKALTRQLPDAFEKLLGKATEVLRNFGGLDCVV